MKNMTKKDIILGMREVVADGFLHSGARDKVTKTIQFLRAVDILDWHFVKPNYEWTGDLGMEDNRPILIETIRGDFRVCVLARGEGGACLWDAALGGAIYLPVKRWAYLPEAMS